MNPQKITTQKPGTQNRKKYAAKMLIEFRWTHDQRVLLEKMAENGHWIGTVNEAERVFNLPITKDGDKRCILVYGFYSTKPWNKKLQRVHKIN